MRRKQSGWDGLKEEKVKGCKEMNVREGRGFNVRDGISMGREERKGETKRDGKV